MKKGDLRFNDVAFIPKQLRLNSPVSLQHGVGQQSAIPEGYLVQQEGPKHLEVEVFALTTVDTQQGWLAMGDSKVEGLVNHTVEKLLSGKQTEVNQKGIFDLLAGKCPTFGELEIRAKGAAKLKAAGRVGPAERGSAARGRGTNQDKSLCLLSAFAFWWSFGF